MVTTRKNTISLRALIEAFDTYIDWFTAAKNKPPPRLSVTNEQWSTRIEAEIIEDPTGKIRAKDGSPISVSPQGVPKYRGIPIERVED